MIPSMRKRLIDYATAHRDQQKWKSRLYALLYNCGSISMLARLK